MNLAVFVVASSFAPITNSAPYEKGDNESVVEAPTVFKTDFGIRYPVDEVKITQGYLFYHRGIDLDGETGDLVRPIMTGKVESAGYSKFGYGNSIVINHGNGLATLYAHLSTIEVEKGDEVNAGTVIGKMGSSGRAFGDHLHLELYQEGKAINPSVVLDGKY